MNNEIEILSVNIIGNRIISFNVLNKGFIDSHELIKDIVVYGIKYFILIENKKLFLKLNQDTYEIEYPKIDQFEKIVSEV